MRRFGIANYRVLTHFIIRVCELLANEQLLPPPPLSMLAFRATKSSAASPGTPSKKVRRTEDTALFPWPSHASALERRTREKKI